MRTLDHRRHPDRPVPLDLQATWERFADQVRAVRDTFPHVELVVVPELMLAAEAPLLQARADWMEVARPLPGPHTDRICALARKPAVAGPGSLYERGDDDRIYNTAIAVSPPGEIVARYRKVFPWQPYEQTAPGSEFVVFDIPGTGRDRPGDLLRRLVPGDRTPTGLARGRGDHPTHPHHHP